MLLLETVKEVTLLFDNPLLDKDQFEPLSVEKKIPSLTPAIKLELPAPLSYEVSALT